MQGLGAGRRAGVVVCGAGVLAVFAWLATGSRELTAMYGGFWSWVSLLGLVGAVGGGVAVLLAYAAARLGRWTSHRRSVLSSLFLAALLASLAGGLVGSLQHDPARQRLEADQEMARQCEQQGGRYDRRDLSCSFPGGKDTSKD